MINTNGYKVIYRDKVYNSLEIGIMEFPDKIEETGFIKPKFIDITVINEDNNVMIIRDEAWMFQFVREVRP